VNGEQGMFFLYKEIGFCAKKEYRTRNTEQMKADKLHNFLFRVSLPGGPGVDEPRRAFF